MSRERQLRCAITGVEIPQDSAYVLDLPVAQDRLSRVKANVALLERMLDELGGIAKRNVDAGGQATRTLVVVS
jgi:hypothetical protein